MGHILSPTDPVQRALRSLCMGRATTELHPGILLGPKDYDCCSWPSIDALRISAPTVEVTRPTSWHRATSCDGADLSSALKRYLDCERQESFFDCPQVGRVQDSNRARNRPKHGAWPAQSATEEQRGGAVFLRARPFFFEAMRALWRQEQPQEWTF